MTQIPAEKTIEFDPEYKKKYDMLCSEFDKDDKEFQQALEKYVNKWGHFIGGWEINKLSFCDNKWFINPVIDGHLFEERVLAQKLT